MNSLTEIQEITGGRRIGSYLHILCPYHEDSNPSMLVWPDGLFRCLACGQSGTHRQLLEKLGRSVKKEKRRGGRNPFSRWLNRYDDMASLVYAAHRYIMRYPDSQYYLTTERLISVQTLISCKIGYLDGYYIFPIYDQSGQLVSSVARSSGSIQDNVQQRYIIPYGHTSMLYAPDWSSIRRSDQLYVVFGILDAITLAQAGYPSVTGSTGKSISSKLFDGFRRIIEIIPDQGEEKEAYKLAGELGWRGKVRQMINAKDINDLWRKEHSLAAIGL